MKDKLKIVIILNGEDFNREKFIETYNQANFLIAADGGLNFLYELKIKPDIILGDMDSVDSEAISYFSDVEVIRYPEDKDLTDGEIALVKALSYEPESITIFSGTGSYFDHSFANLLNIYKYSKSCYIELVTSNSKIFFIESGYTFLNKIGQRVSLFPMSKVENIKLSGFKYNYSNNNIDIFDYSISNVIISNKATVEFETGVIFVVLFDKGFR